jgi:pimeloyl-ACP methyl ester carboxylesterase
MRLALSLLTIVSLLVASAGADAEARYIRKESSNTQTIIFVHGVMGESTATWTNPASKAFWPELLEGDKDFDRANILVVDFPSPAIGTSFSIDELAENLRLTLESKDIGNQSELIFIAHSMGGLVTRAFLEKYRDMASKVKLLYFLATPTTGSFAASIAKIASQNPQFAKIVPMTSDSYLADLQRTWLASPELSSLPSYCAYEIQPTYGIKIVEQQSATNLCNRRLDPIDADHIDIAKPENAQAMPYLAFKSAYLSLLQSNAEALRVEVQGLKQVRETLSHAPQADGQPIYCEAVRFTLLFAHPAQSEVPVRINSIAIHSEPASGVTIPQGICAIDPLSSRPYGIFEVNSFSITSAESEVRAKFIKDGNTAYEVDPTNILRSSTNVRAITLKSGEAPLGLDILWDTKATTPRKVWFSIDFDQNGERSLATTPILIWK